MQMLDHIQPLMHWLHANPHWAGFIVFIVALVESLAFVGLLIPGSLVMTAAGVLIGFGIIPAVETLLWAIMGAVIGDGLSYMLGYYYKQDIRNVWPFHKMGLWFDRGERFFEKHGGKSVFLARFSPLRPVIPVIAGMLAMNKTRFFLSNVTSAIGWAPLYMVPGIIMGMTSLSLSPKYATRFVAFVLVFLVIIALITWLLKKIIVTCYHIYSQWMDKFWLWLKSLPTLHCFDWLLTDPQDPHDHTQLTLALTFILLAGLLLCLTIMVFYQIGIVQYNLPLAYFFRSLHSPKTTQLMVFLTYFGDKLILGPLALIMFIWLCYQRNWTTAIHWCAIVLTSFGAVYTTKLWLHSPRPGLQLESLAGNSFPSGHTSITVALYGFFAVLLARYCQREHRSWIYGSVLTIVLVIIFTRLYLGAHWVTDVIGGVLTGLCCVLVVTISYRRKNPEPINFKTFFGLTAICFVILFTLNFIRCFSNDVITYTPVWPQKNIAFNTWWQQSNPNQILYLHDRFGEQKDLINLQWADSVDDIHAKLIKNGWKEVPTFNIISTVARLSSPDSYQKISVIPKLYLGKKPVAIFTKTISNDKHIVILRLWRSNTTFTDDAQPLWVGTVNYHAPLDFEFWHEHMQHRKAHIAQLPFAVNMVLPSLNHSIKRQIQYPQMAKPPCVDDHQWQGGVLLIQ